MSALTHIFTRRLPRVQVFRLRHRPRREWLLAVLLIAGLWAMGRGYLASQHEVVIRVDGSSRVLGTHHASVGAILRQAGVELRSGDRVSPPLGSEVAPGGVMTVARAHPVVVWAEERREEVWTHGASVAELLTSLGISHKPADRILSNGRVIGWADPLSLSEDGPVYLAVVRAVEVSVSDGATTFAVPTTARTVGEALLAGGINLFPEDQVQPALNTPIQQGLRVHIRRAKPVTVLVDGLTYESRTHLRSVEELLQNLGIKMGPKDYTDIPLDASLTSDMTIEITRVNEVPVTEHQSIAYDTRYQPSLDLEIDQTGLVQPGAPGIYTREWLERYENGELADRSLVREGVEKEPVPEIIGYGTRIVTRTLDTPAGTVEYWRAIDMRASSYTAATAGKTREHPAYGITRSGLRAGKGIVAVDPRLIPLGTRLYVPGYGVAIAGDTGGRIVGYRIDLGYDQDNLVLWSSRVTVYILTPVPETIRYILP